jgi:hypothetical protein
MSCVRAAKASKQNNVSRTSGSFKFSISNKFLVKASVFGEQWAAENFLQDSARCLLLGECIGRRLHRGTIPCYSLKFTYDESVVEWKESYVEGLLPFEDSLMNSLDLSKGFFIANEDMHPPSIEPSLVTNGSMPPPPPRTSIQRSSEEVMFLCCFILMVFFTILNNPLAGFSGRASKLNSKAKNQSEDCQCGKFFIPN